MNYTKTMNYMNWMNYTKTMNYTKGSAEVLKHPSFQLRLKRKCVKSRSGEERRLGADAQVAILHVVRHLVHHLHLVRVHRLVHRPHLHGRNGQCRESELQKMKVAGQCRDITEKHETWRSFIGKGLQTYVKSCSKSEL